MGGAAAAWPLNSARGVDRATGFYGWGRGMSRLSVLPEYSLREYFTCPRVRTTASNVRLASPSFAGADANRWRNSMVIASSNRPSVILGLLVCALGISVSSSADARKANRQGTYVEQGYPNPTPGITAMPRNTPKANIVCWTPCGRPGAIVLGADPDPNIRAFLLRDASGYFGGGGR